MFMSVSGAFEVAFFMWVAATALIFALAINLGRKNAGNWKTYLLVAVGLSGMAALMFTASAMFAILLQKIRLWAFFTAPIFIFIGMGLSKIMQSKRFKTHFHVLK